MMKKKVLVILLSFSVNIFSQEKGMLSNAWEGTKKTYSNSKEYIKDKLFSEKEKIAYKDSIIGSYKKKFNDYDLVSRWLLELNPAFLEGLNGNFYKIFKRTIIKEDNSVSYNDFVKDSEFQYLFVPSHKKYVFFLRFEIDEGLKLYNVKKINRGMMYEDKFDVKIENDKIISEVFEGRVKPFFDVLKGHLIFGYKSNKTGKNSRVYYDLGYDIFNEDEKDSKLEYLHRVISIGSTEFNKTEQLINEKMLYEL